MKSGNDGDHVRDELNLWDRPRACSSFIVGYATSLLRKESLSETDL